MEVRRLFRAGAALFLRGLARFDGDVGSLGARLAFGSKIWEGSISSPVFVRLPPRADFRGEVSSALAVVCLRTPFLGLRFGAGVKSSSSSRVIVLLSWRLSSESTTTTGFRAARRAGRVGDIEAIVAVTVSLLKAQNGTDAGDAMCL